VKKTFAVAGKEFRQTLRDPFSLGMLLGIPAFMLLLYGYALNFDVRHVPLAIQDESITRASRDLVAAFVESTYFDDAGRVDPGTDVHNVFAKRRAKAVLVIPPDFARNVDAGRAAPVQLLVDGSDAATATTVLGYAEGLVAAQNVTIRATLTGGKSGAAPIAFEPRVWYNPELKSTNFLVPGLIGFILMITAVLSTALSVVREKERGTMEQLLVTSLRPSELLIGKTIPYLAISLAATAIILVAARVLFGVAVKGSYIDLFAATLVYLIGALGLGLLVSSMSDSQAMAFQVGSLLSLLPTIFLSGFIFPIRSMPQAVQIISYAIPARYFLVVSRGIILKGAPLTAYPRDLAFLGVYAAIVLAIAWRRLAQEHR
jgi:drug efflux transport system permease protein